MIAVTCEASVGFVTDPRKYPPLLGPMDSHDVQNATEGNIKRKRKVTANTQVKGTL
jgi:hypothetical protein